MINFNKAFAAMLLIVTCFFSNYSFSQCPVGQTEITLEIFPISFGGEIGWELIDMTTGTVIDCMPAGTYATSSTPTIEGPYCVTDGNMIKFIGYDSFGDDWNGGYVNIIITEDGSVNGCGAQDGCPVVLLGGQFVDVEPDVSIVNSCETSNEEFVINLPIFSCNMTPVACAPINAVAEAVCGIVPGTFNVFVTTSDPLCEPLYNVCVNGAPAGATIAAAGVTVLGPFNVSDGAVTVEVKSAADETCIVATAVVDPGKLDCTCPDGAIAGGADQEICPGESIDLMATLGEFMAEDKCSYDQGTGCGFGFLDLAGFGVSPIATQADDSAHSFLFPAGSCFSLYGEVDMTMGQGVFTVGNNGDFYLGFASSDSGNETIDGSGASSNAGVPGIFPLWDDWDSENAALYVAFFNGGTVLVVTWEDVPHWSGTGAMPGDGVTFQMQWNSVTGTITFLYADLDNALDATETDAASASIGIDSGNGVKFSEFSFDTAQPTLEGTCIQYVPTVVDTTCTFFGWVSDPNDYANTLLSTSLNYTDSPAATTSYYSVVTCPGGSICIDTVVVTVFADPVAPTIELTNFCSIDPVGTCDYTLNAGGQTVTGPPAGVTMTEVNGYPGGPFMIEVTSADGCVETFTVNKPPCTCGPIFTVDFAASDPCVCNDDQSANGAGDGTFTETITVTGPPGAMIFSSATSSPAGAAFTEVSPGVYELTFTHIDRVGYSICLVDAGGSTVLNMAGLQICIGNVCEYPVINEPTLGPFCISENPTTDLDALIMEIGVPNAPDPGMTTVTINTTMVTTTFNPSALGVGTHTVEWCFDADFVDDMGGTLADPANPGCQTCYSTDVIVEAGMPQALCNATITLVADASTGCATITPADLDNGSGDAGACGFMLSTDIVELCCSGDFPTIVTLTVTSDDGTTSDCTTEVDLDNSSVLPTASCNDLVVSITGNGCGSINSLLANNNSSAVCGAVLISDPTPSEFCCDDLGAQTYTLVVTDPVTGITSSCVGNVTVQDVLAPTIACPSDKTIQLSPGSCGELSAQLTPTFYESCGGTIERTAPVADIFQAIDCGLGESEPVLYSWLATDPSGNTSRCSYNVTMIPYEGASPFLSCNDYVNVTVNGSCDIEFNADMLLEGGPYGCYDCFGVSAVEIHTETALAQFEVTITDPVSGNSCWGTVTVEDKNDPTVDCADCTDPDVTDPDCIFNCAEEKLFTTFVAEEGRFGFDNNLLDGLIPSDGEDFVDAYVRDNCDDVPMTAGYSDSFSPLGNCSEGTLMTRTWVVNYDKVGGGVGTETCVKYYKFLPLEVFDADGTFIAMEAPHDTTTFTLPDVNGNDYDLDFYTPDPVEDAILMPKQIVVIPDCGVGTDPASIAAYYDSVITVDRDTDDDGIDPDEFDVDCVIESNEGIWYAYPHYYIDGVRPTGPHAQPISEVCNVIAQYNDTPLDACAEGCNGNSKILRTWTILDWCASLHAEYEQIIKVVDDLGPGIELRPISVSVDPWDCKADVHVPAPYGISDNCDADVTYSIGFVEGAYTVTGDAENGYIIHDVPEGTIRIQYVAEDCCGNKGDAYTTVTVSDETAPVPVTKKNLVVELSRLGGNPDTQGTDQGTAKIHTADIDNGSYDSCTDVDMHIRRPMDDYCIESDTEWGDFVTFCCADLGENLESREIKVEIRVCDWNGNCNYLDATVLLEDKAGGAIRCPLDLVLPCTADIWDFNLTGLPQSWNTCRELDIEIDTAEIYDDTAPRRKTATQGGPSLGQYFGTVVPEYNASCGFGAIRRQIEGCPDQWIIMEPAAPGMVTQNEGEEWIATSGFDASSISWPGDQTVDCDGYEAGAPSYTSAICNLTGPTLRTEEVNIEAGACKKILNHWTIIDWCAYNPTDPDLNNSLEAEDEDGDGISNLEDDDDDGNGQIDGVPYDSDGDGFVDTVDPDLFNPKNEDSGVVEGRYEHTQVIKIIDTEAPTVVSEAGLCFGVDTDECTKKGIVLTATGMDNGICSSAWLSWTINVDIDNDWVVDCTYSSDASPTINGEPNPKYLPKSASGDAVEIVISEEIAASKGNHRVEWNVNDGCGNDVTMTTYFEVEDKKAPTPYCLNLGTAVMAPTTEFPDGMVELWAIDFNQNSFDNCSGDETLLYTFTDVPPPPRCDEEYSSNRDLEWYNTEMWFYNSEVIDTEGDNDCEVVGYGEYDDGGYSSGRFPDYRDEIHRWMPGLRSSGAVFTSDMVDASGFMQLPIYVWDECGSKDFCLVNLRIINNGGGAMVAGVVKTEMEETVENVQTEIMNSASGVIRYEMTTEAGAYAFDETALRNDYQLSATKNDDYLNGVSTIDLVILQRHILGLELLDSPYKMIAADINSDKRINGQDLVELRKLILGIYTELPQNDSWKIIDSKHAKQTLTLANPWDYRENISIADMTVDMMGQDFIGAKIGDLDNSALTSGLQSGGASGRVTNLEYEDGLVAVGEEVTITLNTTEELYGYQFTMDLSQMEYVNVEGTDVTEGNVANLGDVMTMSYDNVRGTTGELFTLTLRAKTAGQISDLIGMNSEVTKAEAYVGAELEVVQLTMNNRTEAFSLAQNEPNPFKDQTTIGYSLPEASAVTLTMYDVTGKVLEVIETRGAQGSNSITVDKERLTVGVVYYKLEAGEFTATKHMIVIE